MVRGVEKGAKRGSYKTKKNKKDWGSSFSFKFLESLESIATETGKNKGALIEKAWFEFIDNKTLDQ